MFKHRVWERLKRIENSRKLWRKLKFSLFQTLAQERIFNFTRLIKIDVSPYKRVSSFSSLPKTKLDERNNSYYKMCRKLWAPKGRDIRLLMIFEKNRKIFVIEKVSTDHSSVLYLECYHENRRDIVSIAFEYYEGDVGRCNKWRIFFLSNFIIVRNKRDEICYCSIKIP